MRASAAKNHPTPRLAELDAILAESRTKTTSPSNGYHSTIEKSPDLTKWVQLDLGASKPIHEIRLTPARPTDFADTPGFGFPVRYRVEASDDTTFAANVTTLADHTREDTPSPGEAPVVIQAPEGTKARYVRVTATRLWLRLNDYVFALAELQVFNPDGKNLAAGASVSALDSIEQGRWARKYLIDGFDSRTRLDLHDLDRERDRLLEAALTDDERAELHHATSQSYRRRRRARQAPPTRKVYATVPLPAPRKSACSSAATSSNPRT